MTDNDSRNVMTQPVPVESGMVQMRTLVLIRWFAVVGQATALLIVHFLLDFQLEIFWALVVVSFSASLNFFIVFAYPPGIRLGDQEALFYLTFDSLQLVVLLFLTGGLVNPFVLLLLAPVTVSATVLSRRSTMQLSIFVMLCVTAIAFWNLPLPWRTRGVLLPPIFVFGSWFALVISISFIAAYVSKVAVEARQLSEALSATQIALAREQRLSALGGLAAAAAHELGTPLATIAVVSREIAKDLPEDSPLAEDASLLLSQTDRCRDILAELARRPDTEDSPAYDRIPLSTLLAQAAAPYDTGTVEVEISSRPLSDDQASGREPSVLYSPEIVHGVGNLVQNATEFARESVDIRIDWDMEQVMVTIADDGPGYPPGLLGRLGDPYISERNDDRQSMGLGVFIAQNLLERTGAGLAYSNRPQGGAQVVIRWDRGTLDTGTTVAGVA